MNSIKTGSTDLNVRSYKNNLNKTKEKKIASVNNNFEPDKDKVKVNISTSTINLSYIKSFAKNQPDIRFEKVNSLKEQITQGKYIIDPNIIADNIIG
jgi:flagellar biosynthesis anti-sigma factor FlgM